MAETIIRLPQVKARTGLSRSTIYTKIAANQFPEPIPLGARAVGWKESDVAAWIDACCSTPLVRRPAVPRKKQQPVVA